MASMLHQISVSWEIQARRVKPSTFIQSYKMSMLYLLGHDRPKIFNESKLK